MRKSGKDLYIDKMWHTFGIQIQDHGDFQGFIKKSNYVVYVPRLDNGQIVSFKYENCTRYDCRTFAEVKEYIHWMMDNDPEQFDLLYEAMRNLVYQE